MDNCLAGGNILYIGKIQHSEEQVNSLIVPYTMYHQISNTSCTISQNLNVSRLFLQLSVCNILKPGVQVENADVVGAVPTGNAPTKSEYINKLIAY